MLYGKYYIRQIKLEDITLDYFKLLQNLSLISVSDFDEEKNKKFFNLLDDNHKIFIMEDLVFNKIVASGTIIIENKLIRNYAKVAHLEDIVVDKDYQEQGLGEKLVSVLVKEAENLGCYKCTLHCSPNLVSFYQKNNFTDYGRHMRIDF